MPGLTFCRLEEETSVSVGAAWPFREPYQAALVCPWHVLNWIPVPNCKRQVKSAQTLRVGGGLGSHL